MGKYHKMSAKDKAFERERIRLHSIIQNKDDEIIRLMQEVSKYKMEAESWEHTAKLLETYIGVPKEKIVEDAARSKKIAAFLDPITSTIGNYISYI